MKDTIYKTSKREFHVLINEIFPTLNIFKKENSQLEFNHAIGKLLPEVKKYIAKWLSHAVNDNKAPAGKYKVEDFVDELYIQAYDHFHEVKNSNNLHNWLFEKTDELLEDVEVEEEFDNYFIDNIDNYTKVEWDAMEENFSTDGGGDFVMIEELDDHSYSKNEYVLEDVFIEDHEQELIAKLSKQLSREQINRHVDMVLRRLSIPVRTVFDLAIIQQFKINEIAQIKHTSIQEVQKILIRARNVIRVSFEKRYLGKS